MGDKRSGDAVARISAILLRASRVAEVTPELVWTGKKPERVGDTRPPKPKEEGKPQRSQVSQGKGAALDSAVQGVPTTGRRLMTSPEPSCSVSLPHCLPRAMTWCYTFTCGP